MKKIISLLFLSIFITMSACKKDDDHDDHDGHDHGSIVLIDDSNLI
tara:strand:- start:541 stop:678 length:138 start_codon:yes stop_codon:yes gene_type:complete